MKTLLLATLFTMNISFAVEPKAPSYISCSNSSIKKLEIEVDKYESLPPLSEIKLIVGKKIYRAIAPKALISLETDPPEFAYKFLLPHDSLIDFLQVNLTKKSAKIVYLGPGNDFIHIDFKNCYFELIFSGT